MISIHAPREGGRLITAKRLQQGRRISIHAPREGGDVRLSVCLPPAWIFQSTPPVRGATAPFRAPKGSHTNFNPRPP